MNLLSALTVALQIFAIVASAAISGPKISLNGLAVSEKILPNDGKPLDQLGRPQVPYNTRDSMAYQGNFFYSSTSDSSSLAPTTLSTVSASTTVSVKPTGSTDSSSSKSSTKPSATHKNSSPKAYNVAPVSIAMIMVSVANIVFL